MIRKAISLIFFLLAALCGLAYYHSYFKWRDCYNDLGRCYDSESGIVYLEQAGVVWTLFGILFLIPALVLWFKRPKSSR
jgi:hypothetical protein